MENENIRAYAIKGETVKSFVKLCTIITLSLGMTVAHAQSISDADTYELVDKRGKKTPYLLEKNEIAMLNTKQKSLPQDSKPSFQHPSYRLFSLKKCLIKIQGTEESDTKEKSGLVFYKYGQKDDAYRYITTGMIIVTFEKKSNINPENFAIKNHLKYIKTIGSEYQKMILFLNTSEKNDIELSSALVKQDDVIGAKPNWILPVKLF